MLKQKSDLKKLILISVVLWGLLYFLSYVAYRQTHIQVWQQDQKEYVMFSENKIYLYYFFRPLSWLDKEFTGMNFHIGPHR